MYNFALIFHSAWRWVVLVMLFWTIFRFFSAYRQQRPFTASDNFMRQWAATSVHIQFLLGILLYFTSPVVDYFLHNFKEGMGEREIRFFGMEHVTVMFIAVAVISAGSSKAKRLSDHRRKFKTVVVYYLIGLLLILSSIPWPFSPLVSRPWMRMF